MEKQYQEIVNLISLYAESFDLGRFERLGSLFTPAGSLRLSTNPVGAVGPRAITEAMGKSTILHEDETPRTRHVVTNHIIERAPGSNTAAARSYFTVLQAMGESRLQPIALGRYHDQFVREGAAWFFSERVVFLDYRGDLSQHVSAQI